MIMFLFYSDNSLLLVFLDRLAVAEPICDRLNIMLRLCLDTDKDFAPPPYEPEQALMLTDFSSSCHSKNLFSE